MPVVRSKICGITRVEDALIAAKAGADAIGLVFYGKSPRAVSLQRAREIVAALPPFVTTVGLFVNASRCEINEILDAVPLDMLQFHGDESPAQCEGFHRPWYKALRVGGGEDIAAQVALYQAYLGLHEHPALFTAINADTMELYAELVPFDALLAQKMSDRAVRVIEATKAGELLPRGFAEPSHFECKLCPYSQRCWRTWL